jgi:hypothetical protein
MSLKQASMVNAQGSPCAQSAQLEHVFESIVSGSPVSQKLPAPVDTAETDVGPTVVVEIELEGPEVVGPLVVGPEVVGPEAPLPPVPSPSSTKTTLPPHATSVAIETTEPRVTEAKSKRARDIDRF